MRQKQIALPERFHHLLKIKAAKESKSLKDMIVGKFPELTEEQSQNEKRRPKW